MDITYVKKVQEWVELDNKIVRNKDEMKETIEKKKDLEDDILQYIEENKFDNLSLSISDGNIKFAKKTNTQPLSIKTIKTLLEKYKVEKNITLDIDDVCTFISSNLEKKSSTFMKRDIK
jgi:hypothetical protein